MRAVAQVTRETALAVHAGQIQRFGGLDGVRDEGLLSAALAQPWQGFGDVPLYATPEERAARLGFEIIDQHPFSDGNKRTGAALMGAVLLVGGLGFAPSADDYYEVVYGVAAGKLGYEDMLAFVRRSVSG
jgi:death-on-curing protein